jgi:hypothetical protein
MLPPTPVPTLWLWQSEWLRLVTKINMKNSIHMPSSEKFYAQGYYLNVSLPLLVKYGGTQKTSSAKFFFVIYVQCILYTQFLLKIVGNMPACSWHRHCIDSIMLISLYLTMKLCQTDGSRGKTFLENSCHSPQQYAANSTNFKTSHGVIFC